MSLDIRSGPARVIGHGTVTDFFAHGLRLELTWRSATVAVQLAFESDPDREGPDVRTEWPEGGMRFVLINFDQPDGRGSARPALIGEVGDELLFLHFRVFRYGRTDDRTVHYTFYAVDKADVSWTPQGWGG